MVLSLESVAAYARRKTLLYLPIVDAATGNEKIEGVLGAILCQLIKKGHNKVIACVSKQLLKH